MNDAPPEVLWARANAEATLKSVMADAPNTDSEIPDEVANIYNSDTEHAYVALEADRPTSGTTLAQPSSYGAAFETRMENGYSPPGRNGPSGLKAKPDDRGMIMMHFEAELMHEFGHGTARLKGHPAGPASEKRAVDYENYWRRKHGLPLRVGHGNRH